MKSERFSFNMDRVIVVSVLFLGVAYGVRYMSPGVEPIWPHRSYVPFPTPHPSPIYTMTCDMEWHSRTENNCSVEVTCTNFAAFKHLETSFFNYPYTWRCYGDEEYDENEEPIDHLVKHINLKLIGNVNVEPTFIDNSDWLQRIKKIVLKDNSINVPEDLYKLTAVEDIDINNYFIPTLNFTIFFELKELKTLNLSGNFIKNIATRINNETFLTSKLEILDLSHNLIKNVVTSWKLGNFANLTFLDLSHNAIRNIDVLAFEGLTQLRSLFLSHNHIHIIGNSLLKLNNIEEVTLDHNEIAVIEINDFAGLNKIKKLNFSSNYLQSIESHAFANLTNLKELDLSFNKLTTIEKQLLKYNKKLSTLLLNNNNIETLESEVFEGKNITKFDIQNNYLTGLIDNCFQGVSVYNLDLSNMKITHLTSNTFNSGVHNLNLSHNLIFSISPHAFSELKYLKNLDISHNQLRWIIFDLSSSKMLSSLYLQHNNIEYISKFAFKNLTFLEELDLSDNSINNIDNKSLADLKNLESLRLNNNIKLKNFKNGTFDGLTSLWYLDISNTSISELQNDLFSDLKQLEILNASKCNIEKIQYNAFRNSHSIEVMDLSYNLLTEFSVNNKEIAEVKILYLTSNRIKSISDETFDGLSRLSHLDLSNNKIVHIGDNAFDSIKQLKILNLASNIDLKINTKNFDNLALDVLIFRNITKSLSFNHTSNTRVAFLDLSYCRIENVDNLFLYKIDVKELVLKFNQITQLDKHSFENLTSLDLLDLSSNAISHIQPGTFLQLEKLKTLHLYDNNIAKFEIGVFEGLKSLQILNLSNNEIGYFKNLHVRNLPSLKTISLDNNKIESIQFSAFLNPGIEKITIGGNNIPCKDITDYNDLQTLYPMRPKLLITAEVLNFHSENVDGIKCIHNPDRDDTYTSPQLNATYVLANAIEKLQESLSNKTSFSSRTVNINDTLEETIKDITKKMVEDLSLGSYHSEKDHSGVKSLVYVTVACLLVIVLMYLTIFVPKVKRTLLYRLRSSQSSNPLVNNSVELQ